MKISLILLISIVLSNFGFSSGIGLSEENQQFYELRALYYSAADSEEKLNEAFDLIENLRFQDPILRSRLVVYKGALITLKAKYTFWPHLKFKYAEEGLDVMALGLKRAQEDIESLFIYGTVCDNLPFFFNKSREADRAFNKIIELLPQRYNLYDRDLVLKVVHYIINNTEIYDGSEEQLKSLAFSSIAKNLNDQSE